MQDINLTRVEFEPAQIQVAGIEGIQIPEIDLTRSLTEGLKTKSLEMNFDNQAILGGMEAALVENHVHVVITGDDTVDQDPEIDYKDAQHRDTVIIALNPRHLSDKKAEKRVNRGFWEAVLASNILGEPKSAAEELEQIRNTIKRKSTITKIGGLCLKSVAVGCTGLTLFNPKFAVPLVVAGSIKGAGASVKWLSERWRRPLEDLHLTSDEFEKQVQKKIGRLAKELAEKT